MLFKINRIIRNKNGIITLERYYYGCHYENKNICDSCNLASYPCGIVYLGFTSLTAFYVCNKFGLANIVNVKYRYRFKSYNIC